MMIVLKKEEEKKNYYKKNLNFFFGRHNLQILLIGTSTFSFIRLDQNKQTKKEKLKNQVHFNIIDSC